MLLALSAGASAQEISLAVDNDCLAPKAQAVDCNLSALGTLNTQLTELPQGTKLTAAEVSTSRAAKSRTTKSLPASMEALKGDYVVTYSSLTSSGIVSGSSTKITPDEEGDSITISSFWNLQPVRGRVDLQTGEVTIPCNWIYEDSSLGNLYIAVCNSDGTSDRTAQITGTVDGEGHFNITSWWGIFKSAGLTLVQAFYNTAIVPANATMTYAMSAGSYSFPCYVEQTSKNALAVTNILNRGQVVEVLLNRDRTATIESQVGFVSGSNEYVIYSATFTDEDKLKGYSSPITTEAAATDNNRTITWGDWTGICSAASSYLGHLTMGSITTNFDISYPQLSVSDFEGEGTEENPYKISSLDHLILLSDIVNADTDYSGGSGSYVWTRTYLGKYFALTNDIDMSDYRFDPIGGDYNHRFAGVLDGKGYTIKGLTEKVGTTSYAGLFGYCDEACVIKNIVFDSPSVQSDKPYTGVVAACTYGSIDNITVNNPYVYNKSGIVAGGVVGIVMGDISNCLVSGGIVGGAGYAGGVAGETHAKVYNCGVEDTSVYAYGEGCPSGGVVGNLVYGSGDNLWFKGLLSYDSGTEKQYLGGVVGKLGQASLTNSFATGLVRGYDANSMVGGVVGRLMGDIENCYSTGRVSCASKMTGGLIGEIDPYTVSTDGVSTTYQSSVRNCYTATSIYAETYQYDRSECREIIGRITADTTPTIENIYYDKQLTNFYSENYGVMGSELKSTEGPKGFDSSKWVYTEGAYPRLKGMEEKEAALYGATSFNMSNADSFKKIANDTPVKTFGNTKLYFYKQGSLYTEGYYSSIDNGTLKIGTEFGRDTIYVVNGSTSTYHILNIAPIPFEGDGTEQSPYLIKTKADLIALSEATTVKKQSFADSYFSLENDIDLEYDTDFAGITTDGTSTVAFEAVFEGNGHTLHNIYIANRVFWSTEPTDDAFGTLNTSSCKSTSGFIGRLGENGVIRNLNLAADCKFTEQYASAGSFAGICSGLIENCRNYADVQGISCWVGGIAGRVELQGVVRNCYNAGNVKSGYANAGGIVGVAYGLIENCTNTGDITVEQLATNYANQLNLAGGIAGGSSGSIIKNCINYGSVSTTKARCGGISGSLAGTSTSGVGKDEVYYSINLGAVDTADKTTIGAIGGQSGTTAGSDVYWDAQTLDLKANGNSNVDSMHGVETSVLTSGKALENFDTDIWDFTEGVYPAQKLFADEPKVAAARKVILSIPTGNTVGNLQVDATLSTSATWSLEDGTQGFSIEGNTLKSPTNVTSVISDVLYAVNEAGVKKPFYLSALLEMPLEGEGTETSPYLVANANDWNSLVSYMNATNNDMEGLFIKATADIAFTDDTPASRFAEDGVTYFSGTFDGDGHTVSGLNLSSATQNNGALFRYIGATGTVKNFTFQGEAKFTKTQMAAICDNLYGTLDNVISEVNVTCVGTCAGVVAKTYAGATLNKVINRGKVSASAATFAGLVASSAAGTTYNECGNEGSLAYTGTLSKATAIYAAGLVANCASATFNKCYNAADLDFSANTYATTVAGLIGTAPGAATAKEYEFNDCYNSGNITAAGKTAGLIANTGTQTAVHIVMNRCYNTGDIYSCSATAISSAPTAGIIANYTVGSEFNDCWNSGSIVSDKCVYAGGISGYYTGSASATYATSFNRCYNTGTIIANGNQGGGILAYVAGYTTIESCYNTGDIEGGQMLGGICSAFSGSTCHIYNSYNTGNITGSAYRVGGITAWGASANGTIENCWNSGDIKTTSTTQGVAATNGAVVGGLSGVGAATYKNCYSTGTITGVSRVGGLIGAPTKGKTTLENCYFAGKISAPADSCGSLVGVSIVNNGSIWTDANAITNSYYVLNANSSDNDIEGAGEAISLAKLCTLKLDGYTSIDDYTKPVLSAFTDNTNAVFNAADLVMTDDDTAAGVVDSNFYVGAPDTVTWTSNCPVITFSGNDATVTDDFNGTVTVTATAADGLTKTYTISVAHTSSVEEIDADQDAVSTTYYNLSGVEVARPESPDGKVYIVVRKYADNSNKVVKLVNK